MSTDNKQTKWSDTAFLLETPTTMLRDFHKVMGQPLDQKHPTTEVLEDAELIKLRKKLIDEEYTEVVYAIRSEPDENVLKELADLVYVCYGYAVTYGWDLDEAIRRVHASNMSKLGEDSKPTYREDGKVLKGPNYKEANLKDLV